jgi:apolipoprotein N-acyltransferase
LNYLLAASTGILLVLLYPSFSFTALAPVALTPLLVAMAREFRTKQRFLLGYLAGIIYWFGVCYWIQAVLADHGGVGEWGGWGSYLLFCILKSIHLGVFSMLGAVVIRTPWGIPVVAALWAGLERTQSTLTLFQWLMLGNAGIDMGVPMRLAPITGVYGISFVFAMMSAIVAAALLRRPRKEFLWAGALLLMFLLPGLPAEKQPEGASAVVVQPDISETQEWTRDAIDNMRQRLNLLSLEAALKPGQPAPSVIVWPEAPAPVYYTRDEILRRQVNELARVTHSPILLGTVTYTESGAPLNSAQFVSPDGTAAGRYDKIYLVPFGEYIPPPFGFVKQITSEAGEFRPGNKIAIFENAGLKIGSFICYESAIPHLVREFSRQGAQVFVNISNDGYFGHSSARRQHLELVRMRAAENRRWIVRATNNGITALVDPAGRVASQLPSFIETAARFSFTPISEVTPYARYGDWFAWLCLVFAAVVLIRSQLPHYTPEAERRKL